MEEEEGEGGEGEGRNVSGVEGRVVKISFSFFILNGESEFGCFLFE